MAEHLRLVVDLARDKTHRFRPGVLYVDVAGRGWILEPVGCAVCVDDDFPQTISHVGETAVFYCTVHGELEVIPYESRATRHICIGPVKWSGDEVEKDEILIPKSWSAEERQAFFDGVRADLESPDDS